MIMYNKKIFSERIKEIRNARNETQKEFAKFVNSTAATISAYENGTKNPSLEVVANIANKCNVSIDWLCGLSDKKQINKKIETYSDILTFLYEMSGYYKDLLFSIRFGEENSHYVSILFRDETICNLLYDFDTIYNLHDKKIITDEMYATLIEGLLKKYNQFIDVFRNDANNLVGH